METDVASVLAVWCDETKGIGGLDSVTDVLAVADVEGSGGVVICGAGPLSGVGSGGEGARYPLGELPFLSWCGDLRGGTGRPCSRSCPKESRLRSAPVAATRL